MFRYSTLIALSMSGILYHSQLTSRHSQVLDGHLILSTYLLIIIL